MRQGDAGMDRRGNGAKEADAGFPAGNERTGRVDDAGFGAPLGIPMLPEPSPDEPAEAAARIERRPASRTASAPTQPARPMAQGLDSEGKTLLVPRGISLKGRIDSCDRLIVEGSVETVLTEARALEVARSGSFKGTVDVGTVDVAGSVKGSLTARENLIVRATARIAGEIACTAVTVERGARIAGEIRPLTAEEE